TSSSVILNIFLIIDLATTYIYTLSLHDALPIYSHHSGERYSARANIADNLMEPWTVHNISASYRANAPSFAYRIAAELNNFSNRSYTIVDNYPMPGSNIRINLQITF